MAKIPLQTYLEAGTQNHLQRKSTRFRFIIYRNLEPVSGGLRRMPTLRGNSDSPKKLKLYKNPTFIKRQMDIQKTVEFYKRSIEKSNTFGMNNSEKSVSSEGNVDVKEQKTGFRIVNQDPMIQELDLKREFGIEGSKSRFLEMRVLVRTDAFVKANSLIRQQTGGRFAGMVHRLDTLKDIKTKEHER